MRYIPVLSLPFICLLLSLPLVAQTTENSELTLAIKQLNQVQSTLERARAAAQQNSRAERFYFDSQRAIQDVTAVRQGIAFYLEPTRAQPIQPLTIIGQYQRERAQ